MPFVGILLGNNSDSRIQSVITDYREFGVGKTKLPIPKKCPPRIIWRLVTGYRTEKIIFRVSLVIFLVRMVHQTFWKTDVLLIPENLDPANGRGHFGGQTAGGDPKAFPRLKQPLFAVPALRELASACRGSIL